MKKDTQRDFIAADIGNSSFSLGLFRGLRLIRRFDMTFFGFRQKVLSDTLESWNKKYPAACQHIVISSVNSEGKKSLMTSLKREGLRGVSLKSLVPREMFHRYAFFQKLGEDRIANICYCSFIVRKPAIVIDAGTAINVDIFDGKVYQGGYIISGYGMESEVVQARARGTRLRLRPDFQIRTRRPGLSTRDCLERGIALSKEAFVQSCVGEAKKLLGRRVPLVLLTGGDRNILKKLHFFDIVDSNLTLKGIAAAYAGKKVRR